MDKKRSNSAMLRPTIVMGVLVIRSCRTFPSPMSL